MVRKIVFVMALVATGLVATSCNSKGGQTATAVEETAAAATAYQVDDVLEQAATLVGQEIELEGVCTHICKHGGRKIFLMGSDDKHTLRIESGELGSFDQKCVNSIVTVKGILAETRIDEAYLKAWEEREAAKTEEKHGDEDEGGCSTEKNARGESGNSVAERIAAFRTRISAEQEKTGKAYLSFYHIEATGYTIQP